MVNFEDLQEEVLNELNPRHTRDTADLSNVADFRRPFRRERPVSGSSNTLERALKRKETSEEDEDDSIQEEVLNELFGLSNFASSIRGLFGDNVRTYTDLKQGRDFSPGTYNYAHKKAITGKTAAANKLQHASGALNDMTLNDTDIAPYLRNAMRAHVDAEASAQQKAALRSRGWMVGPPNANKYGEVGNQHDKVDAAATKAAVEKRRAVYAGKAYASIRETPDQTVRRLLNEMQLNSMIVEELSGSDDGSNAGRRHDDLARPTGQDKFPGLVPDWRNIASRTADTQGVGEDELDKMDTPSITRQPVGAQVARSSDEVRERNARLTAPDSPKTRALGIARTPPDAALRNLRAKTVDQDVGTQYDTPALTRNANN